MERTEATSVIRECPDCGAIMVSSVLGFTCMCCGVQYMPQGTTLVRRHGDVGDWVFLTLAMAFQSSGRKVTREFVLQKCAQFLDEATDRAQDNKDMQHPKRIERRLPLTADELRYLVTRVLKFAYDCLPDAEPGTPESEKVQ